MIRFACPGCKRVLAGRDEQAGKVVVCPKCGQRLQVPRLAASGRRGGDVRRGRIFPPPGKASHRPFALGIVLIGVLLLASAAGGIWLWMRSLHPEPQPEVVASREMPPPSNKSTSETPVPPQRIAETPVPPPKKSSETPLPPSKKTSETPVPPPKKTSEMPVPRTEKKPPLPPPSVEDKKEIDLADDLPPELPFDLVDAINVQREKAGCEPIFLDAELSRACQSLAEHLARHAGQLGDKPVSASVPTAIHAAEAPLAAVEKWLKEPERRAAILEPRLRTFAAGFARNIEGQWFSVFDWTRGIEREPPMSPPLIPPLAGGGKGGAGAVVYPAAGQMRVPLWFPGNETPDPLPDVANKLAGYPITLTFPPQTRIEAVTAHLANKDEHDIEVWLSSPEKPANPRFAPAQRNTVCLIAKKPLRPNIRYRVEVSATVNGEPWSAKWGFTTVTEGEIHHEMAGKLLRTLNGLRRRAGLPPVPLDAECSKACAAHARYLGLNAPINPRLNWNEEKLDLPGYTEEGAAVARTAAIQGGGGPIEAVEGLIDSLISRPQVLDSGLREIGLGYTPFALGGWIWVVQPRRRPGREADKEYFYPAPDQEGVPLIYPPNEVPSPIPAGSKDKIAGYAITALFGPRAEVTAATAKLVEDKGVAVDGWLSSPEKPAIAGIPQRSLCFLPRGPLRPDTRYTITFNAEVNGRPWRRTWSFTTLKETDRYADDLEEKIVARVNAVRKAAGLKPVCLDAKLSRACQSHARYLVLNSQHPAGVGMHVHRQDPDLPGASPEGAKAAKESVIAVVLDPQSCVENWMATLYHRIPILEPNLERVGFGQARLHGRKWACVLDTGNGRTPPSGNRPRSRETP